MSRGRNYLRGYGCYFLLWLNLQMHTATPDWTETLQQARKARRWSQLELAMRVGVSQRHISFVECGRAKASRPLLIAWLRALDVPLAVQNAVLLKAGFAPAFGASRLDDPTLAQAHGALLNLLQAHDPMPALVLDAEWNLLHANRGAAWLLQTVLPGMAAHGPDACTNMLDLMAHPDGLMGAIRNLEEVGPALLAHVEDQVASLPALAPRVRAFAQALHMRMGPNALGRGLPVAGTPVLTTRFASPLGDLAFFSMFTTFGSPHDITLASLRVEHLFAADETTRQVVQAQVPA